MKRGREIVLFTPCFRAGTPERQLELDVCLVENLRCDEISRIVLLVDDGHRPLVEHERLSIIDLDARPTYRQWIELSTRLAPGAVSILANSDIYFDSSVAELRPILAEPEAFVALSRHDRVGGGLQPHPEPKWSQDAWAFHAGPPLPATLLKGLDIPLGVPRCDNKVAYVFAVHGWRLFNPISLSSTFSIFAKSASESPDLFTLNWSTILSNSTIEDF